HNHRKARQAALGGLRLSEFGQTPARKQHAHGRLHELIKGSKIHVRSVRYCSTMSAWSCMSACKGISRPYAQIDGCCSRTLTRYDGACATTGPTSSVGFSNVCETVSTVPAADPNCW